MAPLAGDMELCQGTTYVKMKPILMNCELERPGLVRRPSARSMAGLARAA